MKIKKHLIIVIILTVLLLGLHVKIRSGAYDFSGDRDGKTLKIGTFPLTSITSEERCINDSREQIPCRQLQDIQNGDILVTRSSFTLFYRHGHIGLVVDAEKGLVIEALGYGNYSTLESLDKWNYYPTVQVLRLKDADSNLIDQMTSTATNEFLGIPYSIFATGNSKSRTHCSALIWKIFSVHGYDLNSTGGLVVTPRDIANSPYLEVIESHGFGIEQIW